VRYLRTHTETETDEHMALEAKGRARKAPAELPWTSASWNGLATDAGAADRVLFASVAGTLSSFGMNILKAEALPTARMVLDTFTFDDPLRTLDLNPPSRRLRAPPSACWRQDGCARAAAQPAKPVLPAANAHPARVSFNSEASRTATCGDCAEDRPGLLYDLASAISPTAATSRWS